MSNRIEINVIRGVTNVVEIKAVGPQGQKGDTGIINASDITGSVSLTGSLTVSSSIVDFTNAVVISGSTFSGSFVGDGSGLTNIVASGTISSSAQIATDISGAFTSVSSSLSSRVTANEVVTAKTLISSSAQIASDISGSFSTVTTLNRLGVGSIGSENAPVTSSYTVTVASKTQNHPYYDDGSGNGYLINGIESPYLNVYVGRSYKFNQVDNTNDTHPLRFYLDVDKNTAYTTNVSTSGTAGNAGALTQISITEDTPSILYYQCSAHGKMGNVIYVLGREFSTVSSSLSSRVTTLESGQFTNITASGTISSSGDLFVPEIKIRGNTFVDFHTPSDVFRIGGGGKPIQLFVPITASVNISSSANIFGLTGSFGKLIGDGSSLINLPSSGTGGIFATTGSIKSTTNDLQVTGSLDIDGIFKVSSSAAGLNVTSSGVDITLSQSTEFRISTHQGQVFTSPSDITDVVFDVRDISGDILFQVSGSGLISIPVGSLTSSATATASFGRFEGDGSGLTNVISSVPSGTVSSSAQIATEISGAFTAPSSSFSTRVTTLEAGGLSIPSGTVSSSAQIATDISGAFTTPSSSFSTRITTLEAGGGSGGSGGGNFSVDLDSAESTVTRAFATGSTTFTVTHNLNTEDIQAEVYRLSDKETIGWTIVRTSVNVIECSRAGNVADNLFRVVILKSGGVDGIFAVTGSSQNTTNNLQITGSLTVSSSIVDFTKATTISGSTFSGSFVGDGSGLTNIVASGTISSSAQIATDISGSFTAPSASFSTRVTANEVVTVKTLVSSSAQIATDISGSFTAPSASFSTRVTTLEASGGGGGSGIFVATGSSQNTTNDLQITGSLIISGSTLSTASLVVHGSGSTIFEVQGSVGSVFSIDDSLSGSLLVASDISGLPQFEVFSDGSITLGSAPKSLYTTAKINSTTANTQSVISLSTSSYDAAFFDYVVTSASNMRAGNVMSVWGAAGAGIQFTETTTTDIGDTSNIQLIVNVSQSKAHLQTICASAGWTIKTIVKGI